ncbi:MAG: hypothetical protein QF471_03455 [Phycisphaerales bacterium]|nr:hypothetical protein [Phycisphaerales bacterium]
MLRGRFLLLLVVVLTSCSTTSRRVDPFGAVPDDFSVDLTILSRPQGDRADQRTSRIVLEPDGSVRYMARRGIGPNTFPPLVRRLDREQMARIWDSAARLGLTDPDVADVDADLRRVKPPSRRGCVWLLVLTGEGDRWNFTRAAEGDEQPDAAIVAFGRELGALAWAPDRTTHVAKADPVRWDYGPDPWAAYRGEVAEPVLVAAVTPEQTVAEPPLPPSPKPKVAQPKAAEPISPPPASKPEPKVAEPAPAPAAKPEPKVVEPPPAPPASKPEPKVVEPPPAPPASKPESKVVEPPPPAPKPEPKVVKPVPTPRWPLDIRRIHVTWQRTHQDLFSLDSCMKSTIRLQRRGHRLTEPRREYGGTSLSIAAINDRGGGIFDASAVRTIERSIRVCTEFLGLLGAKIGSALEPPTSPDGPFDLWIFVDIPLEGANLSPDLPKNLIALPAVGKDSQ